MCVLMVEYCRAAGSIILMLAYGYEVRDGEDPYVSIVEKAMSEVSNAATPGAFLVDFFPIRMLRFTSMGMGQLTHDLCEVRYFPPWLPGGGWKKHVSEYTNDLNAMCDIPYQFVKDCLVSLHSPVPGILS